MSVVKLTSQKVCFIIVPNNSIRDGEKNTHRVSISILSPVSQIAHKLQKKGLKKHFESEKNYLHEQQKIKNTAEKIRKM